jgi:ribulose 1,5-bisphosphate carboxylase large subunit-like protein
MIYKDISEALRNFSTTDKEKQFILNITNKCKSMEKNTRRKLHSNTSVNIRSGKRAAHACQSCGLLS